MSRRQTRPDAEGLRILVPRSMKPKLDAVHRDVASAVGRPVTRRHALGLAGLSVLAAACGTSTSNGGSSSGASTAPAAGSGSPLAGKAIENHLEIYNWSQYDDPSTFTKFQALAPESAAHLSLHETFYSSNDELLAKLNAGGSTYDIVVPSQNAVAQLIQEGKLFKLDKALLPNLKNLDPAFLTPSFDPTGDYHVIKDFGITMFFYNHKVVKEQPQTMLDFYRLLPKYRSKGRTNILDGAEEVVPLALMAIGLDPNTDKAADFSAVRSFLLSIRPGVSTIDASGYINDGIAGKILIGQGWNGDIRRILQARKKQADITAVIPHQTSEIWSDNWCIPVSAPHPVAAHAFINWVCRPSTAVVEMNYHNYKIPMAAALAQLPASLTNDPLFNVSKSYTDNYKYILNVSPDVVQKRTAIFTEFKAA